MIMNGEEVRVRKEAYVVYLRVDYSGIRFKVRYDKGTAVPVLN
jgi:hypothetical protein